METPNRSTVPVKRVGVTTPVGSAARPIGRNRSSATTVGGVPSCRSSTCSGNSMRHSILVPINESLPATAALEHALTRFAGDEITVLYVIDADEPDGSLRQRLLSEACEEQRRAGEETAERVLEEARQYAVGFGVEVTTLTTFGRPARRIVTYVEENGIDRTVMGTHGRSGLSRLLLGSISETVSRSASVPVTTAHEAGEGEESNRPDPAYTA